MSDSMTEPLFAVKQPPVRKTRPKPTAKRITWTKLTLLVPSVCDECAKAYTDPSAPLGRRAKYRRIGDGLETWLCHWHANEQRVTDGLAKYT